MIAPTGVAIRVTSTYVEKSLQDFRQFFHPQGYLHVCGEKFCELSCAVVVLGLPPRMWRKD